MNPKQFFDTVVAMRQAQKEYFRTRFPDVLKKSKALEAEIDAEIKRVKQIEEQRAKEEIERMQGSLFPDSYND